jgi:tRNA modification GTPase
MIVIDGSKKLTQKDVEIFKHNHDKKRLIVVNKSDLPSKVSELKIQSLLCSNSSNDHEQPVPAGFVRISAKTGEGMDQLRQEVKVMALGSHFETGDSVLLTKLRHKTSVLRAKEALVRLFAAIDGELAGECIALDLRVAAEALGEITGQSCTEDVLDKIFQEFCIGK